MRNDHEKWVSIAASSLVNFGDRITVGGAEAGKKGLVTGFIGKARETVVVQFDESPTQSVTVKKDLVTQIERRENLVDGVKSTKKAGRPRAKSKYR